MTTQNPAVVPTLESVAAILSQLTTPDTAQVRQAEASLNHLLSQSTCITPLSQLLCSSPSPVLRHLSSVVLRRALPVHWGSLDNPTRSAIKAALLPRLSAEPDPSPRRGLIFLTAAICRVEDTLWPDLTSAAIQLNSADNPIHRAAAFSIFQSLSESVPLLVVPHIISLIPLYTAGLDDPHLSVRIAALHAYQASLTPCSVHEGPAFDALTELVPRVVAVATSHGDTRSDEFGRVTCTIFDVLTLVMEIPSAVKAKAYFQEAVQFALGIHVSKDVAYAARSSATEFLICSVQAKPKTLRKCGLIVTAVRSAVGVVFENGDFAGEAGGVEHEDDDADEEEVSVIQLALRLLDTLAARPEVSRLVFVEVMSIVARTFEQGEGDKNGKLAAGYRVMGAVCRGCSAEVTAHAREFVKRLVDGALDASAAYATRARALEALGLACEALDTDEMPDEVTAEVANASLSAVLMGMKHPQLFLKKHACMSLEPSITLFKENTALKSRVGDVIQALGGLGADATVEAVMAVGVLAEHATEAFASSEMYKDVIQGIIRLMSQTAEKDMLSRVAALEAAGAVVSACKDQSVIETLANHAINCLDVDDPGCKHATYSFFARMADSVGGSVVAVFGPRVLSAALQSMEREDVVFVPESDESGLTAGNPLAGDEEDDDPGRGSFQVRTAYLDEKMVATACVGAFASATATDAYVERVSAAEQIAKVVRDSFARSVEVVDEMSSYFHEDCRAAGHRAYSRMAGANHALLKKHPTLAFAGEDFVRDAFTKLVYGMQEDDDIWVVTNVLNSTSTFLGLVSADLVAEHKTAVLDAINLLISGDAACQLTAEDDSVDGIYAEDEESSGDEIGAMIEAVGDVIEAMAHSLRGYFAQDFPALLKHMMSNLYKEGGLPRNKGMVLGAVAAVLLFMNWDRCTEFTPPSPGSAEYELALTAADETAASLLPRALNAIQSNDSKTHQRNAVFLAGVIFSRARASNQEVWKLLPQALSLMQEILTAARQIDGALVDNAAGAVARVLTSAGCPKSMLGDHKVIMRTILNPVPLTDDPTENTTIARALVHIAQTHFEDLVAPAILQKVLSCMVSSALIYHEVQLQKERGVRHDVSDGDPNDKMTHFSKEEFYALVNIMCRIREKVGDEPFGKLGLTPQDGAVLGQILTANRV
eukprot:GFKZ01003510.1.p1 GENE.GFKZ01003510.1~~GFKZ01003510.1.p1  ORF type:complete len:1175 (+),score=199.65 GFKZ01003510.1:34-3525(+)